MLDASARIWVKTAPAAPLARRQARGSVVERPARRTPGHVTGWHLISLALSYAAVQRAACAPGPDCPAPPATQCGGGGARGVHGFAGPADGQTGDGKKW
jgi:hypothetical protein